MDLRPYLKSSRQLDRGLALIRSGMLGYQPFILADDVEVGEGRNLETHYAGCATPLDNNAFISLARDPWFTRHRVMPDDLAFFRECNERYRRCYERIADALVERLGGNISDLSFLEIGCNSGLTLFELARRGAGSCLGIDWGHYRATFAWLNEALGTRVRFRRGDYDNLRHRIPGHRIRDADVVVNTVVLNHQCDPLQFLCYIADRARRALFLWVLLEDCGEEMTLTFGKVSGLHDIGGHRRFPLSFQNDIKLSRALLTESLRRLGFGEIEEIAQPTRGSPLAPPASLLPFTMIFARRTEPRQSAYRTPWLVRIRRRVGQQLGLRRPRAARISRE